jgi:hypothetical protein
VIEISAEQGELAVGLKNGVELLREAGGAPQRPSEEFTDQPSALEVLQTEEGVEVVVTVKGSDVPLLLTGFTTIPAVIDVPRSASLVEATSLPDANLALVATLLAGELAEPSPVIAGVPIGGEQLLGLFLPPVPVSGDDANMAPEGNDEARAIAARAEVLPVVQGTDPPEWQSYRLGAEDALNDRLRRQEVRDNLQDAFDALKKILNWFQDRPKPLEGAIRAETEGPVELPAPEAPHEGEENGHLRDEPVACLRCALIRGQDDGFWDFAVIALLCAVEGAHVADVPAGKRRRRQEGMGVVE